MSFIGAAWAASSAALAAAVFLVIHKKEGEARRQQRGIPWFFGPWLLCTLLCHFLGRLRLFIICLSLRILCLLIGIGFALLLALVLLLPHVLWTPFAAGQCASYGPAAGFRVFGTVWIGTGSGELTLQPVTCVNKGAFYQLYYGTVVG